MEHALKEIPQGQEQEQELSAWKTKQKTMPLEFLDPPRQIKEEN